MKTSIMFITGFVFGLTIAYLVNVAVMNKSTMTGILSYQGQNYHVVPWDGKQF